MTLILYPKTGRAAVRGLPRSDPNSEGMNRFTPAAIAASMMRVWPWKPEVPTVETTASWPWSAVVREGTDS